MRKERIRVRDRGKGEREKKTNSQREVRYMVKGRFRAGEG